MLFQIIIELISPLIALALGVITYPRMKYFHKIFFWQVAFWLFVYIVLYMTTLFQKRVDLPLNNLPVINFYIVIETALLWCGIALYFGQNTRRILISTYFVTITLFIIELVVKGISVFVNYTYLLISILNVIAFSAVFYDAVNHHKEGKFGTLLLCCGLLIYFGCNVPYFSLIGFLNREYPKVSETLFHLITDVTATVRYSLTAAMFATYLPIKNPKLNY
jgi:hypothetical protein